MPIQSCKEWVSSFVVRHNICPFAASVLEQIRYTLIQNLELESVLEEVMREVDLLDCSEEVRTTLMIFSSRELSFEDYLERYELAESLLELDGRPYQLASFHPKYCFADSTPEDPANRSNRSPYAMIHILRWEDVATAIEKHSATEDIPQRNINYLRALYSAKEQ